MGIRESIAVAAFVLRQRCNMPFHWVGVILQLASGYAQFPQSWIETPKPYQISYAQKQLFVAGCVRTHFWSQFSGGWGGREASLRAAWYIYWNPVSSNNNQTSRPTIKRKRRMKDWGWLKSLLEKVSSGLGSSWKLTSFWGGAEAVGVLGTHCLHYPGNAEIVSTVIFLMAN